jgi:hypothetical protein
MKQRRRIVGCSTVVEAVPSIIYFLLWPLVPTEANGFSFQAIGQLGSWNAPLCDEVLDLNKSAVQEGNILRGKVRFRVLYDTRLENPATASLLADCSCLSITETGGSARQCLERNIIPILLRSIFVDSPKLPSHSQHCFRRTWRRAG